jgi:hypothetical protein
MKIISSIPNRANTNFVKVEMSLKYHKTKSPVLGSIILFHVTKLTFYHESQYFFAYSYILLFKYLSRGNPTHEILFTYSLYLMVG